MLSEDVRVTGAETGGPVPKTTSHRTSDTSDSTDSAKKAEALSNEDHRMLLARLEDLWGPPEPYVPCYEETSSLLERMYFGWVYKTVVIASREKLTKEELPPPTEDVRTRDCGKKLSAAMQEALLQRNAWNTLVGVEVVSRLDAASRGVLRWVGVPQQGGYTRVMAAVEWDVAPAPRVAARSEDPDRSPFFNGTVHDEVLFEPHRTDMSTLEEVDSVDLYYPGPPREKVEDVPTPQRIPMTSVIIKTLPHYFWIQFPFLILSTTCSLSSPMILKRFVAYLKESDQTWGIGLLLVLAMLLTQAGQSFFVQRYNFYSVKGGLQYRTALNSIIFEKCFTVSSKALSQPEMNTGRIINMVSTDVERVYFFMMFCMALWNSPLMLIVSMSMLASLVGWCAIMAMVAFLATLPLNAHFMSVQMSCRRSLAKVTDARVKATNEFLSGIRVAKYMTWEPRFIANIEAKRASELYYLKKIQHCRVMTSFINTATPLVMIAVVFVLYSINHELTPEVVFPTISILALLRQPFMQIPWVLTMTIQYLISINRIRNFLECDNASCQSVDDIEKFFADEVDGDNHNIACKVAAAFRHTEITAYVPLKLPLLASVKQNLMMRAARRFCCETCKPASRRPPPLATGSVDIRLAQSPGASHVRRSTSPAASPTTASPPSFKPDQQKDEFFQLEPKVLLRDLSVQIPAGKLTLVLGATGCGKSTLLNALLGQFEVSRGHVWATKSIAYVPQQPWIMNATVRNNILFFDKEDAGRLDAAIRVSQLETDLGLFAAGLETEIGEKGINLSGGQKARVSLARAVYADRDMYLLDDPLSALDAHVGERIVDDCFLGQLAGKTRVLATHQLHVVPKADYVIVLEDHSVAYHGPAADFMQSKIYHHMAASSAAEEEAAKKKSTEEEEGTDDAKEVKAETIDDGGHGTLPKGADEEAEEAEAAAEGVDAGALMTKEEKAKGGVPLTTYLVYFRYCGGTAVAAIVLGVFFCTEILTVSSSIWLSLWSTKHYEWTQKTYLTGYIILVLCGTVSAPSRYVVTYRAMRRGCVNLHKAILRSVSTATMEFFDRTPLGRIMNRFSRDIDLIDNGLQMSLISAMECFFSISSSMLITIISQPLVVIALLPCGYLYLRIMIFFNAANREIRRNTSVMKSPVYTLLGELLSGSSTISAYGRSSVVMKEALQRLDVVYSCGQLENTTNRWLAVRIELLSAVVVTSIAFVGVISVMFNFGDVGLISLSLTMAMQTTGQLNWLIRQTAAVEADMNSVERIEYYTEKIPHEEMPELSAEVDELERRAGMDVSGEAADVVVEAPHTTTVSPHIVKAGSLEFRDVQMRYREGLPLVLRDVSFRIAPREKVGIVGRTGSGKSTLLLTFMRMVDICGGEIVVSGQPIRSYPLRELRKQFSMIPQDPVLFDGTVRLNVDPFLEASSAEVWDALELVGLRERIASEPEGIDGRVLEGGSNFSVGQRQLLCMARALLKKGSGFILMDEVTANIDQSLDRHIQGTVMKAFSAYTVITIAHRLQTVAQYDKIIVMDHGVVAEMGSPRELVEWPDSVFRGMVDSMGKNARSQFMSLLGNEGEVAHLRE